MAKEKLHNLSLETLDQFVAIAAYAVVNYGEDYAPLLERWEHERELARQEQPMTKARRILEAYTRSGGTNAIFSNIESLKSNG
jgi:hypothetical protein